MISGKRHVASSGIKKKIKQKTNSLEVFKPLEPKETVRKLTGECQKPQIVSIHIRKKAKKETAKAPFLLLLIIAPPAYLWDVGCQDDERSLRLGKMLRYEWTYFYMSLHEHLLQ